MNNLQEYIGYTAGILGFIPYIFFILSIRKGTTKLNLAGWILYTIAMIMIVASSVALGAWQTIWLAVSYIIGQSLVIGFALKEGYVAFSKFDYVCLALSFLGLALWVYTKNPLYALTLNVAVDALGTLAIAKKTWAYPGTEDTKAWVMALFVAVLNCFAIATFDFSNALYPMYLVFACALISVLSLRK